MNAAVFLLSACLAGADPTPPPPAGPAPVVAYPGYPGYADDCCGKSKCGECCCLKQKVCCLKEKCCSCFEKIKAKLCCWKNCLKKCCDKGDCCGKSCCCEKGYGYPYQGCAQAPVAMAPAPVAMAPAPYYYGNNCCGKACCCDKGMTGNCCGKASCCEKICCKSECCEKGCCEKFCAKVHCFLHKCKAKLCCCCNKGEDNGCYGGFGTAAAPQGCGSTIIPPAAPVGPAPGRPGDPMKIPEKVGAIYPAPGPITVGGLQRTSGFNPVQN